MSSEAKFYCDAHLKTIAIINIVLSMYIPLFGLFQATNFPVVPMIVATCALGTRVFVTYLLCHNSFLGYSIIWWNGIFGFGAGFLVTWSFYLSGKWKKDLGK